MFDYLILFLLFFLLFLILLSLIFYNVIKTREYFFTNTTEGKALSYDTTSDNFHKLKETDVGVLEFLPFHIDRKRRIRGNLVLTTYSTNTETQYFKVRVMNGSDKLSEGIYEIKPKMDYNYINFRVDGKDDRKLTIDIQKYNKSTQKSDTSTPTGINLVKAYGYYY